MLNNLIEWILSLYWWEWAFVYVVITGWLTLMLARYFFVPPADVQDPDEHEDNSI